jgi:hypothetical protein
MDVLAALTPDCGLIGAACLALGLSRATFHRRQAAARIPRVATRPRPRPARALAATERQVFSFSCASRSMSISRLPRSMPACLTRASTTARSAPCIGFCMSMATSKSAGGNCAIPPTRSPNYWPKGQTRSDSGTSPS